MKNNMRNGFTLVELLVVMSLIAILVGLATARFMSVKQSAFKTSMLNDIRNAVNVMESYYTENQDYGSYNFTASDSSDGTRDGFYTRDSLRFPLSKGNSIDLLSGESSTRCDNGMEGYKVTITNRKVKDKKATYFSCEDTAPKLIDK